ncbi:MAG: hypothetical protein ABIY55_18595 [Kofleriaceae bacterium]
MGDLEPGRPAMELPVRPVIPPGRTRQARPLVGVSGLLLFACMFLPAVRGCDAPMTPLEVPPFLPPYLYGGVFALLAVWRTARGLGLGVTLLRALSLIVVLGSIVVIVLAPPIGAVELVLGGVLLAIVGLFGSSEARVAAAGIAVGVICAVWFGFWTMTPEALIGVHLALASSIGLLVGCLRWLRELHALTVVDMPRAATFVRRRW